MNYSTHTLEKEHGPTTYKKLIYNSDTKEYLSYTERKKSTCRLTHNIVPLLYRYVDVCTRVCMHMCMYMYMRMFRQTNRRTYTQLMKRISSLV